MKLLRPVALTLSIALMSTSCVGNFRLFNTLAQWNHKGLGDKWLSEIIFVGLTIIPVYAICYAADAVIFNSIEFWTGDNPIKNVKLGDSEYSIKKTGDGVVSLHNEEGQSFSAKLTGKNKVEFKSLTGETVTVEKLDGKFKITQDGIVKFFRPETAKLALNN